MEYAKMISSGDSTEVYLFEREPVPPRSRLHLPKQGVSKPLPFRRQSNIRTVKKHFLRSVREHLKGVQEKPCLMTVTYGSPVLDVNEAYKDFRLFIQRLKSHCGESGRSLSYFAVPEFQPVSGRVHFHMIVWGLNPFEVANERDQRVFADVWGLGYVDVKFTNGSQKLAGYLCKYLLKSAYDERLLGVKLFTKSQHIGKYITEKLVVKCSEFNGVDWENLRLGDVIGDKVVAFIHEFDTLFLGKARYLHLVSYN